MTVDTKHDELRELWECRAREKKDQCNSVLFQGLPDILNTHIHNVHWKIVNNYLLPLVPRNSTMLDLGCGYGRIAALIASTRPDIELCCVDFSLTYCLLCNKNTGTHVACADIINLPFRNGAFDSIVAITSLMYIPMEKRTEIMEKIVLLLKPQGKALFIDPGEEFMNLAAILMPSSKRKSTGGQGFRLSQYLDMGTSRGGVILDHGGMPLFSLALPFLYLTSRFPRFTGRLLDLIGRIDEYISRYSRFTIHRWMLITR